ncbi:hypothetical protein [Altererythrobacter sp. GH1-8]|uniref:hypothetical protein n=1 Tax=Altererythrobacter sp. GH1-8 TaxID=3349333 RepID=UPI00374CD3C2
MNEQLIGAGIAVVTLLIGWFLARWREDEKDRKSRRLESYANFIEIWAVSERWDTSALLARFFANETLDQSELNLIMFLKERFDNAHARLMVYGSPKVISALSDLYRIQDVGLSEAKKGAYIKLLDAMRQDANSGKHDGFGCDVDNIMLSGPLERRQKLFEKATSELRQNETR